MAEAAQSLLVRILTNAKDIVISTTDETFDKAVDLSAKDFGRVFEKRASSHSGFSAGVLGGEDNKKITTP
jgi:hypothetical protein